MYKYAVLLILTSCFYASFGQNTVLSFQPAGTTASKKSTYLSYVVSDKKNSKTSVVLKNNDQVEYLLLSKDFAVEEKLQPAGGLNETIFKAKTTNYLTGVSNNLGTCFFYSVKDKEWNDGKFHIRMEVADFKNKTVTNKMLFSTPSNETTIDWYTNEGTFVLLTANDKAKQLIFHIVDNNGNVDTKTVNVDLSGFNKDKLSISEYFSYSQVYNSGDQSELASATSLNKIYVYPDKLFMVVANDAEPPHIWTIDSRNYSISARKLDMTGFAGFEGKKETFYNSSFLYGNNLYVLNTTKHKIEVGIYDFASGKLLKKHEITESSTIPFVETPVEVTQKGRLTKRNEITSNKELCKELFKGSTGMAVAVTNEGKLILTCGAYDKESRSGGGYYAGSFVQRSMPTGGTYSGSNVPVTRTYTDFNSMSNYKKFNDYTYTRTVNFKVIVDPSTFNIVTSNKKLSGLDKINAFIETIDEKSEAQNVFSIGGKNYVSYYAPDTKKFYIKEIEG